MNKCVKSIKKILLMLENIKLIYCKVRVSVKRFIKVRVDIICMICMIFFMGDYKYLLYGLVWLIRVLFIFFIKDSPLIFADSEVIAIVEGLCEEKVINKKEVENKRCLEIIGYIFIVGSMLMVTYYCLFKGKGGGGVDSVKVIEAQEFSAPPILAPIPRYPMISMTSMVEELEKQAENWVS